MKGDKMKIRHGDVLIEKVAELPECKKLDRKFLFEGEVTGHAHRIDIGEIFETRDGELYLRVDALTKVTHEEHKTVTLPKGIYRVTQKRQYNPETRWERVAD
jgi:hypothetical protein